MQPIRHDLKKFVGAAAAVLALAGRPPQGAAADPADRPNIVLVFTDDQGYQDVGVYGSPDIRTPNLDRMAREGIRFTDFYVASPVCSASRAALMTGCYAERVGGLGALQPQTASDPQSGRAGLNPNEITIAEVLREQGYATACVGKWHLGHRPPFLPTRQGFDSFFGIPYSNDMSPSIPWARQAGYPPLPLMEGEKAIESEPDQSLLTKRCTEKAVEFIRANKAKPFFLYLPHAMPHWPLAASPQFRGKSRAGAYGDAVEEIDWSVGQILETLAALGLDERTLVVFASDNGPWLIKGGDSGRAHPLRDGKWSLYEGGMRVPCIMRWPGKIPAGVVCREVCGTIDLLPTFAALAGAKPPQGRVIDGRSIWPLMANEPGAGSPHEAYFYGTSGVRQGKWKLHLARPNDIQSLRRGRKVVRQEVNTPVQLYDLEADVGEATNVAGSHPDVVARLTKLVAAHAAELQKNGRPIGLAD